MSMGRFWLGAQGWQYMKDFGVKGRSGGWWSGWYWKDGNLSHELSRWWDWPHPTILTPGGLRSCSCQRRAYYRLGKKEGGGRKWSVRRIPAWRLSILETCFSLTPVSLLQVYFVLTSQTSQGIYLHQEEFVQHLILTRLSSLCNYIIFPPTLPERLWEPCHEAEGSSSSQFGTISWGHLGYIWDSFDAWRLGQGNIPVVSDDVVDTYSLVNTLQVMWEVEGELYILAPLYIVRYCWSCYHW